MKETKLPKSVSLEWHDVYTWFLEKFCVDFGAVAVKNCLGFLF
jgi:hypothetical protein